MRRSEISTDELFHSFAKVYVKVVEASELQMRLAKYKVSEGLPSLQTFLLYVLHLVSICLGKKELLPLITNVLASK